MRGELDVHSGTFSNAVNLKLYQQKPESEMSVVQVRLVLRTLFKRAQMTKDGVARDVSESFMLSTELEALDMDLLDFEQVEKGIDRMKRHLTSLGTLWAAIPHPAYRPGEGWPLTGCTAW
jgi:hypothetical protein